MRDTGKISDAPIVEIPRFWISVWYCVKITIFRIYVVHIMSYYVLFRIASHTVTLKYFILLHIAYPEHLSKVKILLTLHLYCVLFDSYCENKNLLS